MAKSKKAEKMFSVSVVRHQYAHVDLMAKSRDDACSKAQELLDTEDVSFDFPDDVEEEVIEAGEL